VSQRMPVSVMVWGFLSVVAGGLMTEGGVSEVLAYWTRGEALPIGVGALGACASALLLASAVFFWTRSPLARPAAVAGAVGMIPVHLVGWIFGIVGIVGALLGVAYPVLLLVVLKARPGLGAPITTADGTASRSPSSGPHLNRMEAATP
jgi:hypothetical protein